MKIKLQIFADGSFIELDCATAVVTVHGQAAHEEVAKRTHGEPLSNNNVVAVLS